MVENFADTEPLVLQRADPQIYKHTDGYYYLIASVPEYDRIEIRRAWTLDCLKHAAPCVVWRKHAEGPMSWHIWAPELHWIDGVWYIYFAAGQAGDPWYIRNWVLANSSPDPFRGEWKEKGQVVSEWDSFSLDLTSFEHRGQRYAVWAQKSKERTENSSIYIAKMSTPYTLELPQTRISRPELEWECIGFKVNEGPSFLTHGDKVFITYSASATDSNYCMGLLWAPADADLTDAASWTKLDKPVFVTNPDAGIYGPGHNSFTKSFDDKTDVLVYHARPYPDVELPLYDPNRHTRIRAIEWDSEGFPVFQKGKTQ